MSTFALNSNPLMTNFLVREVGAFRDDPIVILDIGARGGLNPEWSVFADQAKVYCFEPDEHECKRLADDAPAHVTYIPRALGRTSGRATLYQAKLPASTSLYQTRMDYFGCLLNRDNGETIGRESVEARSLDDVMSEYGIKSANFIQIDAEGAELDILLGARACLAEATPLGILSEVRFHEEINGSAPFALLDQFVREEGFRLYDLQFHYQSRVSLPYPGLSGYRNQAKFASVEWQGRTLAQDR